MKEKIIEKNIIKYLETKWAIVEWQNGWAVMIKKWKLTYRMNLQTKGCPDIICYYRWNFIWIEVKKDIEQVKKWCMLRDRYEKDKLLPKSYERELNQIKYRKRILDNWWTFIITSETKEVAQFINSLE